MELPIKITPCPIIESNIEVRFNTLLPGDAIIGMVYSVFQPIYSNCRLEQLPIMQIPADLRRQDPNLKDKPTHILHTDKFNAHIGPSVFILGIPGDYPGWEDMQVVIKDFLTNIQKVNIVTSVTYVGLRFLNFFKSNIFEKINLKIDFNGNFTAGKGTIFRTEFEHEHFINALQITNSVHVKNNIIDADGSLIDITTIVKGRFNKLTDCIDHINIAHKGEKELFFSLLKKEYLESLNPQYK